MADIEMKNIVKKYGDGFPAVNDVTLDVQDGEFMILVGPSGCGKSTLLRMIVGLEDITSGEMKIGGKVVNTIAPRQRNLSMVFQNYALYPHLTVFENIAFPLRLAKKPDDEVRRRVNETAELLELTEHLERKPANLSGGQRQRVAMGRAIVRQADAFLFDEPLSNLDAKLRGQMRAEISRLQRRLGVTTVYVTHDQTEAMTLGDRVAVLRKGVLQQVGSPRELYEEPSNLFVAGFIGSPSMNFLPATIEKAADGTHLDTPLGRFPMPEKGHAAASGDRSVVLVGVRPEHFEDATLVSDEKRARGAVVRAHVDVTEWLGNELYAYVPYEAPADLADKLRDLSRELDSDQMRTQAVVALDPASLITEGQQAELWIDTGRIQLFDPATGENLTRDEDRVTELARRAEQARQAQRRGQNGAASGNGEAKAEERTEEPGSASAEPGTNPD
ncbi:sn-glycerol-3-phosphate ABC transporter ATP-binding protein UgpC [Actinomadura barringtoniae]|uniref:Sn-glycerol-3-phosphate ABC transporter ATP-binding protein UgpC n=1 Tax=Actinomadura barringtoniae TaxID=1427535 RepID=A0A939PGY4_9ACTN|nr:sn-glycerol-3-phosphate ABC transporter ATP-binding protein UgpC [Actinomadura barringtoniae]MBO2449014.1 sn-glycerol-3-phosphate ABC transporter ATP-binding protein UgpC [Actinomadura barringtoniae]